MVLGSDPTAAAAGEQEAGDVRRRSHKAARAEKRERLRRRVEEVALALFARRGFDAVPVEEVCAAAQTSPATFYRYFGSKEGVIFRYEQDFLAAAALLGGSVDLTLEPADQVREILVRCAALFESQRDIRLLRDQIVLANTALLRHTYDVERRFETALADALAASRREREPSAGTLLDAAMCMVVLRLALVAWRHQGDAPLEPLTLDIFETLRARLPRR